MTNEMPAVAPPRTSLATVADSAWPDANAHTRATTDVQVIRMWLHRKSTQTIRAYSSDISAFFTFVGCTLAEVRLEDVQAFADDIAEESWPHRLRRAVWRP